MTLRKRSTSKSGGAALRRAKSIKLVSLIIIASVSLIVAARAELPYTLGGQVSAVGAAAASQEEPDEVSLTLRPEGFDPLEIIRPAGRFMLSIDNRSGVDELVLLLKRGNRNKVFEMKIARGAVDWSQTLDLRPGRYTLTVADHPDWKCEFLVTERS